MLHVPKVLMQGLLRDPITDELPISDSSRCQQWGWDPILGLDSIRNLWTEEKSADGLSIIADP